MYKKISLLALLSISTLSLANPWSGNVEVKSLYPFSGGLIFRTNYVNTELSSCDGGTRFQISINHPNYQVLASSMMAAFMANKKITFNIDQGQKKTCQPTINRFIILK